MLTREQIVTMARGAELDCVMSVDIDVEPLEKFASMIAAIEREECAKTCEAQGAYREEIEMALECAWAIRMRSDACA